ncbi:MAG TPA: O-acetyl-ADP-ribose deacetylase [Drouetiella sp.]
MAELAKQFNKTKVSLVRGDITRQEVDGIVNAANSSLLGGGGVDGAIHRAGGPSILQECEQIRRMQGGCKPGNAVITGGGKLKCQYVIHTVGPKYRDGRADEAKVLASAYKSSLELANQYELKSIAIPSIGTGAYGYPLDEASEIALDIVHEFCQTDTTLGDIRLVLFDQFSYDSFAEKLAKLS